MLVADGMGGAAAGERASALAVKTLEESVLNTLKWFFHLGGQEEHALVAELREVLARAHRAVFERAGRLDAAGDGHHVDDGVQRRDRPFHRPRGRLAPTSSTTASSSS